MDWTQHHCQPMYQEMLQRGLGNYAQQQQQMLPQNVHDAAVELTQYASRFAFQGLASGQHPLAQNQRFQQSTQPQQLQQQQAQQSQQQHVPPSSAAEYQQMSGAQPEPAHGAAEPKEKGKQVNTNDLPGMEAPKVKKRRAKKPKDAPRRPKSAYMFFLGEFRGKWKVDHPETQRVSDVGVAAGEAWRSLTPEQKAIYEEQSVASKADYARAIAEYVAARPKPVKRRGKPRQPGELRRPTSAYFFFLNTFREAFKKEHPDKVVPVGEMGRLAGLRWALMPAAERQPYERLSAASKALYARLKSLTPEQRAAHEAAAAAAAAAAAQQEAGAEDDEEHSADEAAGQQASDAAQQLDDLAQHQHGAARYMAHAAQDPFAGQPADSQAASAPQPASLALQEAFEKHPAASFPLAQFLSMDHPAVRHWVPQQLPPHLQLHAPQQQQSMLQQMQQQLRDIGSSPLHSALAAAASVGLGQPQDKEP